jgi:hypothetical protein
MGQQVAACKLTITVDGDHCWAFVKLLANLMDFAVDVLDVARDQPEQPFSREDDLAAWRRLGAAEVLTRWLSRDVTASFFNPLLIADKFTDRFPKCRKTVINQRAVAEAPPPPRARRSRRC